MKYSVKSTFALIFILLSWQNNAQSTVNRYRIFFGAGNLNTISDVVSYTDKSFLGEVGGQIRIGLRLNDNYELNFAAYGRKFPDIAKYPGMSYNQFLGYSASFIYEFRKPDSRWGLPFGIEGIKYNRNLDSTFQTGGKDSTFYDHYDAISIGPKIGVRCHFGKYFFMELEANLMYEQFKWDLDWADRRVTKANTFTSFKFIGITANLAF